jgi:uncharacterized membrane protein YbhN (UPF0104 family)
MIAGFKVVKQDPPLVRALLGCTLWEVLNTTLVIGGCYWAMGFQPHWYELLAITVLGNLAFCMAVTPAGLGFYEGMIGFVGQLAHIQAADSVTVTLVSRFLLWILLLLVWPWTHRILHRPYLIKGLIKGKDGIS